MIKPSITLLTIFLLFLTSCTQVSSTTSVKPTINLSRCTLSSTSGRQINARCGTLTIAENPSDPHGRMIDLNIVVIPSISRSPETDPLFLLAGGPGQSSVETFQGLAASMSGISELRDIVLLDQRGTGKSNPLRCLIEEEDSLDDTQMIEILQTCPTRLDADVRFYSTEIAMQDLDAVRKGLGYEKINLYGASYGTRAALTYLRMFPDHVRTVTLDAVVDADFVMFVDAAQDGQKALDLFFSRCFADPSCQEAFPNLRDKFNEILLRLDEKPVRTTISHPITHHPTHIIVTRQIVTSMVFNMLYSAELTATLPLAIQTIYQNNDFTSLVSQAYLLDARLYDGMFYAVTCTEDAPFVNPVVAATLSQGSVFGDRTIDFIKVCESWPKGRISDEFREQVKSDTPVLLFSGEADPITPPRHAERAAQTLTNHLHLIIPEMGHGILVNQCAYRIFMSFIVNGSLEGIDTTCIDYIEPFPFFLEFSGPLP